MVFFSITYAGVDAHIAGIQQELRSTEELLDLLRNMYKHADVMNLDRALLRKCVEEAKKVEESMRVRIGFLNELIVKTQQLNAEINDIGYTMSIRGGDNE